MGLTNCFLIGCEAYSAGEKFIFGTANPVKSPKAGEVIGPRGEATAAVSLNGEELVKLLCK